MAATLDTMKQRGITVALGAVFVVLLTLLVGRAEVPYVELVPGPTFDTLGQDDNNKDIIILDGATATTSAGQLRFLTVGVRPRLTLLQAIVGWWRDSDAVVPRELIYGNQTDEQAEKRNVELFATSESKAKTAALARVGYPMKVTVKNVPADLGAEGKLRPGDVIATINGVAMDSIDRYTFTVRGKPIGTTFALGVIRDGATTAVDLPTVASPEDGKAIVGASMEEVSTAPFKIDIPIENIGGPSAGLMLTLGIIDKVKPEDLTGGKIIAGTGEIDGMGAVGGIGGIPQKLIGAREAGATFFLTPDVNCAEAVANDHAGLTLVQVKTADEALLALEKIRAGAEPELCPGAS